MNGESSRSPSRRPRRRGVGTVLTIVLGIVFVIGCGALAFLTMSSRAIGQATWGAGGALAEVAAESIAEEVFHRLQRDVADPASPVFRRVRLALLSGHPPVLDLSGDYSTNALYTGLLKSSRDARLYRSIELEPPKVFLDIAPERPGSPSQRLRIETAARVAFSPVSRRTFRTERAVGITPVFVPKPFDQCTLAILEYDFLKTLPHLVRETRRLIDRYNDVPIYMAGWAGCARSNHCSRPECVDGVCCGCIEGDGGCCGCPAVHCHRLPVSYETSTWFFDLPQTRFSASLYACERYSFPVEWAAIPPRELQDWLLVPEDSVIFAIEDRLDLAEFEHEKKLAEHYYPRIRELERQGERLNRLIVEKMGTTLCRDPHDEWRRKMMRCGREMRQALGAAIRTLNEVLRHVKAHTRPDLRTDTALAAIEGARGRLKPLAVHIETAADLSAQLAARPALSGHLACFGDGPLRLELPAFRGRALVSRFHPAGGLLVGDVRLADPARDRLVLWSSSLSLQGSRIEAGLFAAGRAYFPATPQIRGSLVMRRLVHRAHRSHDEDLRGSIEYDPWLYAGPLATDEEAVEALPLDRYVVGIGPALLSQEIER